MSLGQGGLNHHVSTQITSGHPKNQALNSVGATKRGVCVDADIKPAEGTNDGDDHIGKIHRGQDVGISHRQ